MEHPTPAVSVVVPVFNSSGYIAATLESVFQQTFSNYEVLLVDDGSSDTAALESALLPFRSRIRHYHQQNSGPSSARNRAIREARGKYIALLDSDDLWLPQHLERQIELLRQDGNLGLVYCNNVQWRDGKRAGNAFDQVSQAGPVNLTNLLAERCTVNTSSVAVLRAAVMQAGLFDEGLRRCEDFDLWLRLAAQGVKMSFHTGSNVIHRLGNGLSSDQEAMKRARRRIYENAFNKIKLDAEQTAIVSAKLKELEIEIEISVAKRQLAAGQFHDALLAVERVRSLAPGLRPALAKIGLRVCPSLARRSYRRYVQLLQWHKQRKARPPLSSAKDAGTVEPQQYDRVGDLPAHSNGRPIQP